MLTFELGDITKLPVDAIVNAANSALQGGGGVDGAIHRAGGPSLMTELRKHGHCPTGSAVVTSAGRLPARYVFHAVGPIYRDGKHGEPDLLRSCYRKCFELAEQHGVKRISFPAISTGVYGYPVADAAQIAVAEAHKWPGLDIIYVLFSEEAYRIFTRAGAPSGRASSPGTPAGS